MVKKKKLIKITVLAVASLGLATLLITNKNVTNFVGGNICDKDIIERHNRAIISVDNFADNVKDIALEVELKPGYSRDINCVYIVYQHYSYSGNAEESRSLLETYKSLQKNGRRIDAKMMNQKTVEQMEMYVKSLEHNRDIGDKADGSG